MTRSLDFDLSTYDGILNKVSISIHKIKDKQCQEGRTSTFWTRLFCLIYTICTAKIQVNISVVYVKKHQRTMKTKPAWTLEQYWATLQRPYENNDDNSMERGCSRSSDACSDWMCHFSFLVKEDIGYTFQLLHDRYNFKGWK